jgi:hypothetical protein
MTIPSEHHGFGNYSTVEQLALVAIVICGIMAGAIWVYLLW